MDALLSRAQALSRPEQQRVIYTTTAAAAAALFALLAYSRHCYLEWHALGEGGVPRNVRGWLQNVLAHVVARRDHRAVPAPYEKHTTTKGGSAIVLSARDEEIYGAPNRESFFPAGFSLPTHSGGARPRVPTTVFPQRQTSRAASPGVLAAQDAYLGAVAAANPALFAMRPSALESPKFDALWLVPGKADPESARWFPPRARGEVAHVHPEGSAHMFLSLVDAAEVVRRGWGERHKMSGVAGILPWGYVLVYAPRDDADGKGDWEVWKGLVIAAARVMARSAGFEGEVVVPQ
ncbi:hypothetical protein F4801DRAFT_520469 [Xylaria longipes]|nr:hypothetical protein F4801DRAFT_520469 [Xylaria longipes]